MLKVVKKVNECDAQVCNGNKFYNQTVLKQLSKEEMRIAPWGQDEIQSLFNEVLALISSLTLITKDIGVVVKYNEQNHHIPKIEVLKSLSPLLQPFPQKFYQDLQNKIELIFKNNSTTQRISFLELVEQVSSLIKNYQKQKEEKMNQPYEYFEQFGDDQENDQEDLKKNSSTQYNRQ
ncbi:Hypothetical_protein [Hexamita inflata]|uniref:Hypothetical_protein n=1 Tax=Hexamita inflata TaxID=28002 RepID=A0AA86QMI0_9EUKA|nr:Hypothetical protein HINF_LOCUS46962 [Hexamita inflata]